jgi:hypothetical protein
MTRCALASLIVLLGGIAAVSANAQAAVVASSSSMNVCGHDIEIGAAQSVVLGRFGGAGCVVNQVAGNPNLFTIAKGGVTVVTMGFSNGLLSTITRDWATGVKSPEEYARAVVNALQEVQAHGSNQCELSALNQSNSSLQATGSVMKCGRRMLVVSVVSESGQEKLHIQETLGDKSWQITSAK